MHGLMRLILFVLLMLPVSSVSAQIGESVTNVNLDYQFGSEIHLTAFVPDISSYSSIKLILQPDGQSPREIEIMPSTVGSIVVDYDVTVNPLPFFARIYYWFELISLDGVAHNTASYWFDYRDDRFQWNSSETDLFIINWVDGAENFGEKAQEIAREGLKAATNLLPVTPDLPIRIYVYPDLASLHQALSLTNQPWKAGHASPDIGVLLVSNDSQTATMIEMERQIPHEIMHILEYKLSGASYSTIPAWLSEGLATSVELYPDPDLQRILNEAYTNKSLLTISSLCDGFPQDAATAQLAYAQSVSFVNFLTGRFGTQVFTKLIENAASGQTCSNAVNAATGITLDQLEKDWIADTFIEPSPVNFGILAVVIASGVLFVIMLIILLRKRHSV